MSRVVVTGMGALSPLAEGAVPSFDALIEGRCGIRTSSLDLNAEFESRIAGEVRGVDFARLLGPKEVRRYARYTQLALVAAREALSQAKWAEAGYRSDRVACIIGVGFGGLEVLEAGALALNSRGPKRISPFSIPATIPNMGAGAIAELAGAQGPSWCTSTACASGAHAIGQAMRLIRDGSVDAAICGGAEACVTPLGIGSFARMGALSSRNDDPSAASRPFDRDRDGFVIAEGAAILVLEREEAARRRGVDLFGCIGGFGASSDAFHATQPHPIGEGAVLAMRKALTDAGVAADRVGYVNAHGTGTRHNDSMEIVALRDVFGSHMGRLLVSSTKGATGHMLGAAGAFEALVTLLAIRKGQIPPTLNLQTPDAEEDVDLVPLKARERRVDVALSNSFGFAGQNASLVLTAE